MPTYLVCLASWALCLASCGLAVNTESGGEEAFIGWKGEIQQQQDTGTTGQPRGSPWVQQLSWKPRAFLYHNLISEEEAFHLRKLAAPQMKRSTVVGQNGTSVLDPVRTSYGTFIPRLSDPVLVNVSERVAQWVKVPQVFQEDMQVLRYGIGQKYSPHMDSLIDDSPRMATVLIYLSDTEEGGETAFPEGSEWISEEVRQAQGPMSECAAGHVAVKPRLGDALLFYSLKADGTHEPACMHTGCPVVRGHKWTSTLWVHSMPFRPQLFKPPAHLPADPGLCKDDNDKCKDWAAQGECERNAGFMVGGGTHPKGACMASCKACEECQEGDTDCYMRNRKKGDWLIYEPKTFI